MYLHIVNERNQDVSAAVGFDDSKNIGNQDFIDYLISPEAVPSRCRLLQTRARGDVYPMRIIDSAAAKEWVSKNIDPDEVPVFNALIDLLEKNPQLYLSFSC